VNDTPRGGILFMAQRVRPGNFFFSVDEYKKDGTQTITFSPEHYNQKAALIKSATR